MTQQPGLSVVLPCRNQGDHIGRVLESYAAPLQGAGIDYELVAVPNACTDDTAEVVRRLGDGDPRLRCVELEAPGWGRAVLAGIAAAKGRVLCYTNSARTDPAEIPKLFELYQGSAPCIAKVRRANRNAPLRELGSWLYNLEARLLFGVTSGDVNGTPKILSRESWERLHPDRVDDLVDLQLLAAARREGVRLVEMTREGFSRHGGKSSTNLGSAWRMYAGALSMRLRGLHTGCRSRARGVSGRGSERSRLERRWAEQGDELRDPHEVAVQWQGFGDADRELLRARVRGPFWDLLAETGLTLFVTREYEHLLVALDASGPRPRCTHLRLPHPNGLAWDARRGVLHVASTRNPNVVFGLAPVEEAVGGVALSSRERGLLFPVHARYLPGALYLHDLALIGGRLHANAVGMNAVVELPESGGYRPVWWPASIGPRQARRGRGAPRFDRNYLQLNSIAAGRDLASSCFSASVAEPSARRPGHRNFPVDRRGVIFSGRTREVLATGLTRPHSARWRGRKLYVDDSGYGRVCRVEQGRVETVAELPGWTRGLCFAGDLAFVATSRVLPRFHHYAPGLDPARCECGIHAVDLSTGRRLASLLWPEGNQIFAVEGVPAARSGGLPFGPGGGPSARRARELFYGAVASGGRAKTR